MKKKIVYISIFFTIVFLMLSCSAYASNVLIISEEDVVHGSTVGTMLDRIASDEYNIGEISIEEGKSLAQVVGGIDATGKTYDSVIIQLPKSGIESVVNITAAI
ncbi:MAG: hypothetical protein K6D97_04175, partial [Clostridia bacterium]|nr:hypothetical protein [Clostridia bacterium]